MGLKGIPWWLMLGLLREGFPGSACTYWCKQSLPNRGEMTECMQTWLPVDCSMRTQAAGRYRRGIETMTVTQLSEAQKLAIRQASFAVLDAATSFLQHLVRIDTTNPPGLRCREIAVLFKEQLDALGYTSELLPVDPADLPLLAPHDPSGLERVNILGKRKSSSKSPAIVEVGGVKREKTIHFNGHTDVVPCGDIESWTYPPFGAVIHDGTIYGRGVVCSLLPRSLSR